MIVTDAMHDELKQFTGNKVQTLVPESKEMKEFDPSGCSRTSYMNKELL